MGELTAIDVCAGAGGWGIASRGLPIKIVEAIDVAEDCLETYAYNHPGTKITCMDATKINWKKYKGIDIVLGGIPCEEVSPARRGLFRKPKPGTIEKWHSLIDSVLAGISLIKPTYWSLENVIQMRRHLPPLTPYWIVNASSFCGQSRKRMFAGRFPCPPLQCDTRLLRDYLRPGPFVLPSHVVHMDFRMQGKRLGFEHRIGRTLNPEMKSPTVIKYTKRLQDVSLLLPDGRRRVLQFSRKIMFSSRHRIAHGRWWLRRSPFRLDAPFSKVSAQKPTSKKNGSARRSEAPPCSLTSIVRYNLAAESSTKKTRRRNY